MFILEIDVVFYSLLGLAAFCSEKRSVKYTLSTARANVMSKSD